MPDFSPTTAPYLNQVHRSVAVHPIALRSLRALKLTSDELPLIGPGLAAVSLVNDLRLRSNQRALTGPVAITALHLALRAEDNHGELLRDRAAAQREHLASDPDTPEQGPEAYAARTQLMVTAAHTILHWLLDRSAPTAFPITDEQEEFPAPPNPLRNQPLWVQLGALSPALRTLEQSAQLLGAFPDAPLISVQRGERQLIVVQGAGAHLTLPVIAPPDEHPELQRQAGTLLISCGPLDVPVTLAAALHPNREDLAALLTQQRRLTAYLTQVDTDLQAFHARAFQPVA